MTTLRVAEHLKARNLRYSVDMIDEGRCAVFKPLHREGAEGRVSIFVVENRKCFATIDGKGATIFDALCKFDEIGKHYGVQDYVC